jgi:hypothetical protein
MHGHTASHPSMQLDPRDAPGALLGALTGARIANARGTPGTAGFLARTLHDDRLVLVTAHHVAYGDGAADGEPIVLASRDGRPPVAIGTAAWGRRGIVRHEDGDVYVDCAAIALDARLTMDDAVTHDEPCRRERPAVGARVTRRSAEGVVEGVVVDDTFAEVTLDGGRRRPAPRQVFVRAAPGAAPGTPFTQRGDSGSALRDASGAIVGLLWGRTADGASIACPIAAVLWVLHVRPVAVAARGRP